jgi:hypothetical protein
VTVEPKPDPCRRRLPQVVLAQLISPQGP